MGDINEATASRRDASAPCDRRFVGCGPRSLTKSGCPGDPTASVSAVVSAAKPYWLQQKKKKLSGEPCVRLVNSTEYRMRISTC